MEQQRVINDVLPAKRRCISLWIFLLQIPCLAVMMLFLGHKEGEPKRLILDSAGLALAYLPSFLSLLFALRELGPRRRESRIAGSIVAIALSTTVIILNFIAWYYWLWLDQKGVW